MEFALRYGVPCIWLALDTAVGFVGRRMVWRLWLIGGLPLDCCVVYCEFVLAPARALLF